MERVAILFHSPLLFKDHYQENHCSIFQTKRRLEPILFESNQTTHSNQILPHCLGVIAPTSSSIR
jgi:hypothetical protein